MLSTVLANVVLNELDWWIHSQWEGIKTKYEYKNHSSSIHFFKKSNLKEMYIIRYCDDFKILCRTAKDVQKTIVAVRQWLKERLSLEINTDKSKVVNIRKNQVKGLDIATEEMERAIYIGNDHFAIEKLSVYNICKEDTAYRKMYLYFCLSGQLDICWENTVTLVKLGESVLIPASIGAFEIRGACEILKAYIPDVNKDIIEPLRLYGYTDDEIESKVAFD